MYPLNLATCLLCILTCLVHVGQNNTVSLTSRRIKKFSSLPLPDLTEGENLAENNEQSSNSQSEENVLSELRATSDDLEVEEVTKLIEAETISSVVVETSLLLVRNSSVNEEESLGASNLTMLNSPPASFFRNETIEVDEIIHSEAGKISKEVIINKQEELSTEGMKINNNKITPERERIGVTEKFGTEVRKRIKLTMKQGLVMNQVLGFYAIAGTSNELCRIQSEEFKAALRAFEPWALQMVDSSSKASAGMLFGNLADFGSYDQCIGIEKYTSQGLIKGKLCSLKIIPGPKLLRQITAMKNISQRRFEMLIDNALDGAQAMWSVCVPHACKADDVLPHFNRSIQELTQGLQLDVALTDEDCLVAGDTQPLDVKGYLFVFFLIVIVLNVVTATGLEWKTEKRNAYVGIFSLISNGKLLFASNQTAEATELSCLHGIRFLSECYILAGHRYLMGMAFPTVNSLYVLDWVLQYTTTFIIGGTVSVDSFLFISSLLVSYNFFNSVTKYQRFDVITYYLHRFFRITPALAIVAFTYALLIDYFGSGPLWRMNMWPQADCCKKYWWSAILHIQAYINPAEMCVPQAWYLSLEMMFYYFSPLILYPLWKWPVMGYVNYVLMYLTSVSIGFFLSWTHKYSGGHPVTRRLFANKYYQNFYIKPHARAPPYIIGLGFGYLMFKQKGNRMKIPLGFNLLGWTAASFCLTAPILGSHIFQEETHVYNRFQSSAFLSLSRSAWTLGICWLIWVCETGNGGFINAFLSLHLFRVLGRICYAVFLVHLGFQFMKTSSARGPAYFSDFEMIYSTLGDITVNSLLGILFALVFEYPFTQMSKMVFVKRYMKKTVPEKKNDVIVLKKV